MRVNDTFSSIINNFDRYSASVGAIMSRYR